LMHCRTNRVAFCPAS